MPTILDLKLCLPENQRLYQSAGSVLHGVLMELIDTRYAEELHQSRQRPFSQYICFDKDSNSFLWRVAALNAQAEQELLAPLMKAPSTFFLKQKNLTVEIKERVVNKALSYDELAEGFFMAEKLPHCIDFRFVTSATFKSGGKYLLYPEPFYIFQNLLNRWNLFAGDLLLQEADLCNKLVDTVKIGGYNLSLHPYSVDGAVVDAFRGSYRLLLTGNPMISRIICLLCAYAEFSGIGIKTALGMGGVTVEFSQYR